MNTKKQYTIRKATIEDAGMLSEIDYKIFGDDAYDSYTFEEIIEEFSDYCYVAINGDNIIGFILCEILDAKRESEIVKSIKDFTDDKIFNVTSLGVLEEHRGKGVAGKLLNYIIDLTKTMKDKQKILLQVRASNENAIKLYKKYKFETQGTIFGYYDDGEDGYIMVYEHKSN